MSSYAQAAVAPRTRDEARPPRPPRPTRWSGVGGRTPSPFRKGMAITAARVKARARELGTDLVGIASAQTLNA
ncbi:MAG: hypothetical protein WBL84_04920, partial [Xanthobacteraceae bacterium]